MYCCNKITFIQNKFFVRTIYSVIVLLKKHLINMILGRIKIFNLLRALSNDDECE
ncbi:hypothetical protein CSC2_13500 [Clostridium zeae]|uniref:Uncharacterized protein n=1 Tax=Clostridium zeae TaxID=2759022 RepID=A0ABQ1E804_9CLOT|nr:hypothetical protein CSC2_13500 [Clostridium zeae]